MLKQSTDKTAPLVDLLPRNTLLVLDEPDKLAEAAESYARQIPEGDKFFVDWRHTLESGLTTIYLTEAIAIENVVAQASLPVSMQQSQAGTPAPPKDLGGRINLRLVSLDAFRPLDTRAPEPEIAEQMRRSFF